MKPLITNIQRFCVNDGPGIRTTVFFKGCTLHCPWCANPENISCQKEFYYIREACKESCRYAEKCKLKNHRDINETEVKQCVYGAAGWFGTYYTPSELYLELKKDVAFYGTDGGVTFSGGEALLFLMDYEETIVQLEKDGISMCVETALTVPSENCIWAAKHINDFFIDIKLIDKEASKKVLGGNVDLFCANVKKISLSVPKEHIVYRIPLVPRITCTKENLEAIIKLVLTYPADHVEIFSVHHLGDYKYERLGKCAAQYDTVPEDVLYSIQNEFTKQGILTKVCKL